MRTIIILKANITQQCFVFIYNCVGLGAIALTKFLTPFRRYRTEVVFDFVNLPIF